MPELNEGQQGLADTLYELDAIKLRKDGEPGFKLKVHQTNPDAPEHEPDYLDQSMSLKKFQSQFEFARRTRVPEVLCWGPEWWYYEKQRGNPGYWQHAKQVFTAK